MNIGWEIKKKKLQQWFYNCNPCRKYLTWTGVGHSFVCHEKRKGHFRSFLQLQNENLHLSVLVHVCVLIYMQSVCVCVFSELVFFLL